MSKSGIARVQVESMFWIHGLPFLSYHVVVGKWRKSVTGVVNKVCVINIVNKLDFFVVG